MVPKVELRSADFFESRPGTGTVPLVAGRWRAQQPGFGVCRCGRVRAGTTARAIERDGSDAHAMETHELVRFPRNEMGPAAASRAHDHAGLCLSG